MEINGFDVDEVLRGYITAALFSTNDESTPSGGEPLDRKHSPEDLPEETRDALRSHVVAFLERTDPRDLTGYRQYRENPRDGSIAEYLGHDLWLDANRHGTGFWDRTGLEGDKNADGTLGERLSKYARSIVGENWLYIGDDKKVYVG